jgi:hypothetical protein
LSVDMLNYIESHKKHLHAVVEEALRESHL